MSGADETLARGGFVAEPRGKAKVRQLHLVARSKQNVVALKMLSGKAKKNAAHHPGFFSPFQLRQNEERLHSLEIAMNAVLRMNVLQRERDRAKNATHFRLRQRLRQARSQISIGHVFFVFFFFCVGGNFCSFSFLTQGDPQLLVFKHKVAVEKRHNVGMTRRLVVDHLGSTK
jgi:hypothetical protein